MTSLRLLAGAFTRFYSVIFSFPCSTLSGYVLRRSPLRDIASQVVMSKSDPCQGQ